MIKIVLTNRLVNALAKKLVSKMLAKKLGTDGKVTINELSANEVDGRVILKVNAEINMSSSTAENLIDSF